MKIKHILLFEDVQKLKSLGQQYPEMTDAVAELIKAYIKNPKRPLNQLVNATVEQMGVNRGNLQKVLKELGFDFGQENE